MMSSAKQIKVMDLILKTNIIASVIILTTVPINAELIPNYRNAYLTNSVQNISTQKLFDFETVGTWIVDNENKVQFYAIMAIEIERRKSELSNKFHSIIKKYIGEINKYEQELQHPFYNFISKGPGLEYSYQQNINKNEKELPLKLFKNAGKLPALEFEFQSEATSSDFIDYEIYKIQAEQASFQYMQQYKYYRFHLENHKNYLETLKKLYNSNSRDEFIESVELYKKAVKGIQKYDLFR